jgi:hypothetical protein
VASGPAGQSGSPDHDSGLGRIQGHESAERAGRTKEQMAARAAKELQDGFCDPPMRCWWVRGKSVRKAAELCETSAKPEELQQGKHKRAAHLEFDSSKLLRQFLSELVSQRIQQPHSRQPPSIRMRNCSADGVGTGTPMEKRKCRPLKDSSFFERLIVHGGA